MKKTTLLLIAAALWMNAAAQKDTKDYRTYVKNDRLVHYCNHNGITIVVDATDGGIFEPAVSVINDSGHEILFEPKKIRAYCYAVKKNPKSTRNMLARYLEQGLDRSPLVKDSLRIYTYEEYSRKQGNAMFWGNVLATAIVATADAVTDAATGSNTPENRYWARAHTEEMAEAGEAQRRYELKRIDEGYWRANTIFDMTEHCGFIGLKHRKADHIVLEIPVDGETYTFLIDNRKRF